MMYINAIYGACDKEYVVITVIVLTLHHKNAILQMETHRNISESSSTPQVRVHFRGC